MLMGIFGGALSLGIPLFSTSPWFLVAAAVAADSFVAMAFAPAFPGTAWSDPESVAGLPRP